MDFLFLLFRYFPYGGLQRNCLQIGRACVERGHTVHVHTSRWDGERPDGLQITVQPLQKITTISREEELLCRVKEHLHAHPYDAVVGFNRMPGADLFYSGDPCYLVRQEHRSLFYRLRRRYRLRAAWERAMLDPGADTEILLVAERQKEEYQHTYHTPDERFHVLPPNVCRETFRYERYPAARAEIRQEFAIPADHLVALLIGSRFGTKGLDRALHALAALPQDLAGRTHLLVVGDDKTENFEKSIRRLGVGSRVLFAGGRTDVARFYCAADLLVHPARAENTGTVLLEAIVMGLPVLVTDVCGYASHVRTADAGRVLASPFSQPALNRDFTEMLAAAEERARWSRNGQAYREHAQLYGRDECAATIIEARALRNKTRKT